MPSAHEKHEADEAPSGASDADPPYRATALVDTKYVDSKGKEKEARSGDTIKLQTMTDLTTRIFLHEVGRPPHPTEAETALWDSLED